jgi:hypothetical protein
MDVPYHLEIWQITAICLLMLPLFFIANYVIVKRFVAAGVARDMSPENRSKRRPKKRF